MSRGSKTKPVLEMCHCRPTYYSLYIVMYDINMRTFDKGGVNTAWLGGRIFQGDHSPLWCG